MDTAHLLLLGIVLINIGALILGPLHLMSRLNPSKIMSDNIPEAVRRKVFHGLRKALSWLGWLLDWLLGWTVAIVLAALLAGGSLAAKARRMRPGQCVTCATAKTAPTFDGARATIHIMAADIGNIQTVDDQLRPAFDAYESMALSLYTVRATMSNDCFTAKLAPSEHWFVPVSSVFSSAAQLHDGRDECLQLTGNLAPVTETLRQVIANVKEGAEVDLKRLRKKIHRNGVGGFLLAEDQLKNLIATCESVDRSIETLREEDQDDLCMGENAEAIMVQLDQTETQGNGVAMGDDMRKVDELREKIRCIP